MNSHYKLYLASQSASRQALLKEMGLNYQLINQSADETIESTLSLEQAVQLLAVRKMEHVSMPEGHKHKHESVFVLTADTLTQDSRGVIQGKPKDLNDARNKIKALRGISHVSTAFCLDKKIYKNNSWVLQERIVNVVNGTCFFDVPDNWLDSYLLNTPALSATGGLVIEDFGAQFAKYITGSYCAIRGLPLFELRESLEQLGFFE